MFLYCCSYRFSVLEWCMADSLLAQIRRRRLQLSLKQNDMYMRAGISRQQYHRIEKMGNPRLDTLELIAIGLNAELKLIPKEHLDAVNKLLDTARYHTASHDLHADELTNLVDDPWNGLL